jgi:hypothetical protein
MALAEVQAALARLATQPEARDAFARDPVSAGRALGLDDPDAHVFATLAPPELERFAASLRAKRALDARKYLPLTALALGPGFGPRLRAHLAGPPRDAREDALALVAELRAERDPSRPWLGDLARYEGATIVAGGSPYGLWLRRFRWPVLSIAAALARVETVPDRAPRAGLALWLRTPGGRLTHRTWRLD